MKIKLELFGASRDLSDKDYLEFNIEKKISIKDFKKKIIEYVDENFKGNENYKKILKTRHFALKIIILFLKIIILLKIKKLELFLLLEVVNASFKNNRS